MRRPIRFSRASILIIAGFLAACHLNLDLACGSDLERVKARIKASLQTEQAPAAEVIARYLKTLDATGRFSDLPYGGTRENFHAERLYAMTRAYRMPGHEYSGNAALKQHILRAYDYWADAGIVSTGWFFNWIDWPRAFGKTMLLLEAELTPERITIGCNNILMNSWQDPNPKDGQNEVWMEMVNMMRACLTNDEKLMKVAVDRISDQIRIKQRLIQDGIQPGNSFHAHLGMLYNGAYGRSYADDISQLFVWLQGTEFQFSQNKRALFSSLMLDGSRWMIVGDVIDYNSLGRNVSRGAIGTYGKLFSRVCDRMIQADPDRASEYTAWRNYMAGQGEPPSGNRAFWSSDFMVHRRPDFYTSVYMASPRRAATEVLVKHGGEIYQGRKDYHIADGNTYIMRSGKEYSDGGKVIFPVWDWRKLPGTTCEQATGPLPSETTTTSVYYYGKSRFVGTASDGEFGVAGVDFRKSVDVDGPLAVTAKKAYFYFDNEFVCLGQGIRGHRDFPIYTTLNQCFHEGAVTVAQDDQPRTMEGRGAEQVISSPRWVHHDGIGYCFLRAADVGLMVKPQSGRQSEIESADSNELKTYDVFSLFIHHGIRPVRGSYAYAVVPNVAASKLTSYTDTHSIEIKSNSGDVQAVRHGGIGVSGLVFYKPGSVALSSKLHITVDAPCFVLVREKLPKVDVTVSNPLREDSIHVMLNDGPRTEFDLPTGLEAGASLTRSISLE